MNRRESRENAFFAFFEGTFDNFENALATRPDEEPTYRLDEFGHKLIEKYIENADTVNNAIEACLTGWKSSRVARVNLALLRLAVTEMKYVQPDMDSVAINEAVELCKKYGDEEGYQFVNGVLGNISRGKLGTQPALKVEEPQEPTNTVADKE